MIRVYLRSQPIAPEFVEVEQGGVHLVLLHEHKHQICPNAVVCVPPIASGL